MERVTLHSEGTPLCSFKSAASVPIRSLKAHFTPTQNGSGDPSPSNVREIVGRTGLNVNRSKVNLIPENIEFISAKLKPYTNGSDAIISRSVFKVMYFEIPKGTFYCVRDNGNTSVLYVALSDEPPAIGVQTYNVITATYRYAMTIDNTDGHRYLIIFGLTAYETAIEGIRDVHLRVVSSLYDQYEDPSAVLTSVAFPSNGKNRVDRSTGWTNGCYEENTGRILTNGSGYRDNKYIAVIPGENYTMSWSVYGFNMRVVFYNSDKRVTRTANYSTQTGSTFAVADDEHYIRICQTTNTNYGIPEGLQIEHGSTATTYEAYSSDNTFYGGYVDPVKGVIVAEHAYQTITSCLKYGTYNESTGKGAFWYLNNSLFTVASTNDGVLCDRLVVHTNVGDSTAEGFYTNYANGIIRWTENLDMSLEDYRSYLAEHPIHVTRKLIDPIEFPLDSVSLLSFEGPNYIWSSANEKVETDYDLFETKMIQDAKKRALAYNQPHLESQTGSIVSFTPQVRAPIKELKCEFQPIQDLHDYDHPWPAGANDNMFHFSVSDSGTTWSDNCGYSAISVNDDSIIFNGTATSEHQISVENNDISIPAGAHYICTTSDDVGIQIIYNGSMVLSTAYGLTGAVINMNIELPSSVVSFKIIVKSGASFNNEKVGFMIRKDSGETAEWTPYMNVCPIDGWTGVNVTKTGANIAESEYVLANTSMYSAVLFIEADLKPSTTYTLSFVGTAGNLCYTNEKLFAYANVSITGSRQSVTFTTKAEISRSTAAQYYSGRGWIIFKNAQAQPADNTFTDVQLEVGSSATDYEPYSGAVYNVEFPATKNLFDQSQLLQASGYSINSDGYYNGTWRQFSVAFSNGFPKQPSFASGIRYTLSLIAYTSSDTTNRVIVDFNYTDGTTDRLSIIGITPTKYTMTSASGKTIQSISGTYGSGGDNMVYIKDMQIESGVTATPYEPYGAIYGGYVDPVKGTAVAEWISYKNLRVVSQVAGTYRTAYRFNLVDYGLAKPYPWSNILCDQVRADSTSEYTSSAAKYWSCRFATPGSDYKSGIIWLFVPNGVFESVTDINNYLDNHPIEFCYRLFTPIEYQLTPTQLKAFKDQNNIWSDTNGNTTVKYWTH